MRSDAKLEREVAAISDHSRDELIERWTKAFGKPPIKGLHRGLMERAVAWHLQTKRLGGLSRAAQAALSAGSTQRTKRSAVRTAEPDAVTASSPGSVAPAQRSAPPPPVRLTPGMRLMREWNGRMHVVDITDSGILFDGKTYASLTAVAARITGAKWSGPRFFGLVGKGRGG